MHLQAACKVFNQFKNCEIRQPAYIFGFHFGEWCKSLLTNWVKQHYTIDKFVYLIIKNQHFWLRKGCGELHPHLNWREAGAVATRKHKFRGCADEHVELHHYDAFGYSFEPGRSTSLKDNSYGLEVQHSSISQHQEVGVGKWDTSHSTVIVGD